jgi:hypothetical protein
MSKFAAALRAKTETPTSAAPRQPEVEPKAASRATSRKGAKHIGGYFDPDVSKQLRALALSEDTTVQALLAESLNILFQSRRLPTIAQAGETPLK